MLNLRGKKEKDFKIELGDDFEQFQVQKKRNFQCSRSWDVLVANILQWKGATATHSYLQTINTTLNELSDHGLRSRSIVVTRPV